MKILKRIIRIIINLIVGAGVLKLYLKPWISTANGMYNSFEYLIKIYEKTDITSIVLSDFPQITEGTIAREGFAVMPHNALCYIFTIVILCISLAAFMNVLNMLLSLIGIPKRGIIAVAWWFSLCGMVIWYMIFDIITIEMYVYPIVFLVIESLCFFMTSLADGLVEIKKKK